MIANRLRRLRDDLGNSQDGMAAVAGVAQRSWSDWERHDPQQMAALARVARHYEVSADYLLGLTDDPRSPMQRALPDGSGALLELYSRMSQTGQANLLAVAHALQGEDERRRAAHALEDWIASVGGQQYLDQFAGALRDLVAAHGNIASALAELDRFTREQTAQHPRQDRD